jgi:hypothetical protein
VGEEELMSFVLRQLELHKMVMKIVKKYVDEVLAEVFDIDPARLQREDPGTYFAIVMKHFATVMELARPILADGLQRGGEAQVGWRRVCRELEPVSARGSVAAAENTRGFEVVLEKGWRPIVNIYFRLGGAGELYIEVSADGAKWRTLHYEYFDPEEEGRADSIVTLDKVAYPYIRVRTPTTGIDVEFEVVATG